MDIVIVGNSDFAKMMGKYIREDERYNLLAYTVSGKYIAEDDNDGIPVIAIENLKEFYNPNNVKLLLAIGYSQVAQIKKSLFEQLVEMGYSFMNYIHPRAIVDSSLISGSGNIILEGVIIGKDIFIGNGNLFFQGAVISHNNKIGDYNTFASNAVMAGYSQICNNNFIGLGACIRNNITIGSYVFLGGATYIDIDLPDESVALPPKSQITKGRGSKFIWDKI